MIIKINIYTNVAIISREFKQSSTASCPSPSAHPSSIKFSVHFCDVATVQTMHATQASFTCSQSPDRRIGKMSAGCRVACHCAAVPISALASSNPTQRGGDGNGDWTGATVQKPFGNCCGQLWQPENEWQRVTH